MQNVIFEPQLGGFGVGCRTDDLAPGVAQPSFGDFGGDVRTLEKFVGILPNEEKFFLAEFQAPVQSINVK